MAPDVSVLIVTYNSARYIEACLDALEVALARVSSEVLVYDNASSDDTVARVQRKFPAVQVVEGSDNLGFAAACNRLGALSRGHHLWLLNPDTRADPHAAEELLRVAAEHPEAQLYGARTTTPDGRTVTASAQGEVSLWSLACFATGLSTVFAGQRWSDPESLPNWDRASTRRVPMVSGGALMISRAAWNVLGGFDQRFFMYGEDADLCARARRMGFEPLYIASAVVEHEVGASSSAGGKLVLLHRGKITYVRKLWSRPRAWVGTRLILAGVALRAAASRLGVFPDRQGRSLGDAWAEAWRRRREWRHGW